MFSKDNFIHIKIGGFSLIEVLITSAIIGIVTAIVVVKYGAFNSSVLLRNQAFEIALSIREAQIFAISTRSDSASNFRDPYGIYVENASSQQYSLFVDDDFPRNGYDSNNSEELKAFTLDSRFEINGICLSTTPIADTSSSDCGVEDLSIVFVRPDFDAVFFDDSGQSSDTIATIRLVGVNDSSIYRDIIVTSTGLISVE